MTRIDTEFPHRVRHVENLEIPMPDGCRLAARLWLPENAEAEPVPAILEYIPYRKRDFMRLRDESIHSWFAGHGYAAIRVDMRGSGESEGVLDDEYLKLEQDDAVAVIDWLAAQPWCSGAVGMMGKSWGAYNSLQVAARRPPALKAIIAVMGTDNRYEECVHYTGGCLMNDNFWWGAIMQVFNARPPDPAVVGERWRALWLERLQAETFWPALWLEHQKLDEYWRHGSVCFDYDAIECPTWIWGGWADAYRDSPFRLAENLRVPHRVTMGPWAHLYPHEGLPGPAVGFLQEALRWWDHWLKGGDDAVTREPPLQFYMMEAVPPLPAHAERPGRWIAEQHWPSPHVDLRRLVLNDGTLDADPAAELAIEIASPQTTGLAAGENGSFAIAGDIPGDPSLDAFGSRQFDGAPLATRWEILGRPELELELSADRPAALVAARLIDVAPDGAATVITGGYLNLTHREGHETPQPLQPGHRYRVRLRMHGIAYAVPAGHRLRVALSSAYWPIVWPSPEAVRLKLQVAASALLVPVRRPQLSDDGLEPPPEAASAAKPPVTILRPGRIERSVTVDQTSGAATHRLFIDGGVFGDWGKFRLDEIGLEMAHVYERTYSVAPDNPCSARAEMTQSYEMGRGAWQTRIDAGAVMTSTPTTFELAAWVEAFEGPSSVCRRDWKHSIPRRGV
jgi:putative CocE/NonD family hydrolase